MRFAPRTLGRLGEHCAAWFYRLRGYRVLARNLRSSAGEIDLVVQRGATVVIAEVKTRQSLVAGEGHDAVDRRKREQLLRLGDRYAAQSPAVRLRYDVLSIFWTGWRFVVSHYPDSFFAFLPVSLSAPLPLDRRKEKVQVPRGTLGAALRERRWTLKLEQKEVAARIGVTTHTYADWEVNKTEPAIRYIPGVIAFLGYDWRPEPTTFGGRIRAARTRLGLSAEELGRMLGFKALETVRQHENRPAKRRSPAHKALEAWLASVAVNEAGAG